MGTGSPCDRPRLCTGCYDSERPSRPRDPRNLLGCGLRRSELAAFTFAHNQQRDGRLCTVDVVTPSGGKVARAAAVSPLIEAGNIYLPHPQLYPWVNDFIEECAAFPNGAHDDQVDAMTQILLRWNAPVPEVIQFMEPVMISPI